MDPRSVANGMKTLGLHLCTLVIIVYQLNAFYCITLNVDNQSPTQGVVLFHQDILVWTFSVGRSRLYVIPLRFCGNFPLNQGHFFVLYSVQFMMYRL